MTLRFKERPVACWCPDTFIISCELKTSSGPSGSGNKVLLPPPPSLLFLLRYNLHITLNIKLLVSVEGVFLCPTLIPGDKSRTKQGTRPGDLPLGQHLGLCVPRFPEEGTQRRVSSGCPQHTGATPRFRQGHLLKGQAIGASCSQNGEGR